MTVTVRRGKRVVRRYACTEHYWQEEMRWRIGKGIQQQVENLVFQIRLLEHNLKQSVQVERKMSQFMDEFNRRLPKKIAEGKKKATVNALLSDMRKKYRFFTKSGRLSPKVFPAIKWEGQ